MAAHVTDSVYYQMHCPDTSNTDVWYKVYSEMYQSAYDTTAFMHPNTLFWRGNSFTGDTIPIGIMDYSFYVFKPDALTTGTYFTFDTVNTHLVDKVVRPGYPYNTSQLFIAAPLVQSAVFSNPIFRIDPQFILSDMFTQSNFSGGELRIDFGDGHGWVAFDPTVVTHHQVEYTDVTDIVIKVAVYTKKGDEPIGSSTTKILVGSTPQIPPDKTLHFPGLTVGVYNSCNSTGIYSGKTILYLSGFDLLDFIPALNRTPAQIYSERLAPEKIIALRNLGYNFMVVDWNQSTIDMRFNALYLVNLLDYLKQQMAPGDFEQFVIMGESMGGIIGRYALAYMEDSRYEAKNTDLFFSDANDPNNKFYLGTHPEIFKLSSSWHPAGNHNTRLLITIDSPHQGANLPISIQLAYRHVMNAFGNYIGAAIKAATTAFNLMLDSQAAQQMLIYHIDTQAGSGYKTYQRHEDNLSFYGQLQDQLGGYPQYAKVVLMSSGALDGTNQPNVFTGGLRSANDRLLDFKASLFARVLWLKVPIFKGNVRALTNPNGQGHVFDAQAGFYGIRIKLKWFGIKIHIGYHPMFTWNENANVRAYCTTAGGSVGDDTALISNTPSSNGYNLSDNYWLLNLFHYSTTNDGNGCVIFDAHVGLNGFASVNTELQLMHRPAVLQRDAGTGNDDARSETLVVGLDESTPSSRCHPPPRGRPCRRAAVRHGRDHRRDRGRSASHARADTPGRETPRVPIASHRRRSDVDRRRPTPAWSPRSRDAADADRRVTTAPSRPLPICRDRSMSPAPDWRAAVRERSHWRSVLKWCRPIRRGVPRDRRG